jgi:serine/threonine protein kinase
VEVDWWAVGIIMYELLVGKTPFVDKTREKVEKRILEKSPKWPDRTKYNI